MNFTFTQKSDALLDHFIPVSKGKLTKFLNNEKANLEFPYFNDPLISIIILTYNKVEYTLNCLESILIHLDLSYEVIIIDNCSTDETHQLLNKTRNIHIQKNESNMYFAHGSNQGAEMAKGKYLLFFNNDAQFTPGLAKNLLKGFEYCSSVGAVGAKIIFPNGKLQEAGSMLWNNGWVAGYGRNDDPFDYKYSFTRKVDYCSAACLMVSKEVFFKIGMFETEYHPYYFEDTDLCTKLVDAGYEIIFRPDAIVYHFEYSSSPSAIEAEKIMRRNSLHFKEKWQYLIKNKFDENIQNHLFARSNDNAKRILFFDGRVPVPHQGNGYVRANYILRILREIGYFVTLFPLKKDEANVQEWEESIRELTLLGIEVVTGPIDQETFCQERQNYYDLVVVSRVSNYLKVKDQVDRYFKEVPLIFDLEALFSKREQRKELLFERRASTELIQDLKKAEQDLINLSHMVFSVTEEEREDLIKNYNCPPHKVQVIGHCIETKTEGLPYNQRKDFLFVGSFFNNSPNYSEIIYFIKNIWPSIQSKLGCNLSIVGSYPPKDLFNFENESIKVIGKVDDLEPYYNSHRVFIVPHRFAAGFPWKLSEALSFGIPCVISKIIAEDTKLTEDQGVLTANSSVSFAQQCVDIYSNAQLWQTLRTNAFNYIKKSHSKHDFKNQLRDSINHCL